MRRVTTRDKNTENSIPGVPTRSRQFVSILTRRDERDNDRRCLHARLLSSENRTVATDKRVRKLNCVVGNAIVMYRGIIPYSGV